MHVYFLQNEARSLYQLCCNLNIIYGEGEKNRCCFGKAEQTSSCSYNTHMPEWGQAIMHTWHGMQLLFAGNFTFLYSFYKGRGFLILNGAKSYSTVRMCQLLATHSTYVSCCVSFSVDDSVSTQLAAQSLLIPCIFADMTPNCGSMFV